MSIYRLRIVRNGNTEPSHTYIHRDNNGCVHYIAADETPLPLSNLLREHAAETRFRLIDVAGNNAELQAAKIVAGVLETIWRRNMKECPRVQVIERVRP
jgi:hypothetical protein